MKKRQPVFSLLVAISACFLLLATGCEMEKKQIEEEEQTEEKEQIQLNGLRSVISKNTENESIQSSLLEVIGGAERNLSDENSTGAIKILNGLANIVFAAKDDYFTNESATEIIGVVYNTFQEHELAGSEWEEVLDKCCGATGTGCSRDAPRGTTCWQSARTDTTFNCISGSCN